MTARLTLGAQGCRNESCFKVRHVHPSFPCQKVCDGAGTQVLPWALGPSDEGATHLSGGQKSLGGGAAGGRVSQEAGRPCVRPLSTLGRKCHVCRMRADCCSYCSCPPAAGAGAQLIGRRLELWPKGSEPGLEVRTALQRALLLLRKLCANDQSADCDPEEGQVTS